MSITVSEANTKLTKAISNQNFEEVLKWLPQADIYATSSDGLSPLHEFYSCRSYKIMEFALENGVDPNCPLLDMDCQTLIYGSIRSIRPELVQLLVDKRANINAIDANGDTPLSFAIKNQDRIKLVPLLLELGADASLGNNVFSILKNDSQRESDFFKYLKEFFEKMIAKDRNDFLKEQIKRLRSLKDVPQYFLNKFETFEMLAESDSDEESSVDLEEKSGIGHQENVLEEENYSNVNFREESSHVRLSKPRKFSDAETNDTYPSNPSLNRFHSSHSSDEGHHCGNNLGGGNHGKGEEKHHQNNKNAKLQPICEQEKEEGTIRWRSEYKTLTQN